MKRTTEGRYEQLVRITEGLSAIEHLVLPLDPGDPVRDTYYDLVDEASASLASARERNFSENGWVYGEEILSPNVHPDYTDPDLRRTVFVGIVSREEADDVELYTSGPFPMVVEEDENGVAEVIVESEEDLIDYMKWRYEGCFAAVRPMPFAAEHRSGCTSNWRELLEAQQR